MEFLAMASMLERTERRLSSSIKDVHLHTDKQAILL